MVEAGAEAVAVGDKMENILNCPICKKEVYSEIGKGCKMCGMILEEQNKKFCCNICMRKYNTILRNRILKGGQII